MRSNNLPKSLSTITAVTAVLIVSACAEPSLARDYNIYEQALEDLDESRYEEAEKKLRKVLAANPNDADAHADMARVYMNLEKCPQTIAEATRAIELDPKMARAYAFRSYCFFKSGKLPEGFADSQKLVDYYTVNSNDWAIWNCMDNRARAYQMVGKIREAKADLATVRIYKMLDDAGKLREAGSLEAAIEKIDQILVLEPLLADLWYLRGVVGSNQRKHWQAIADYSRAMRFAGDLPMLYYFRGDCYQQLGMHQQAIDDYSKVIDANPRIVAYRFVCEIGRLRDEHWRDDTSAVNVGDVHFLRAQSYAAIGKLPQALKDIDAVLAKDPKDDKALTLRAELILGTGKYDDAIKDYTRAIEAKPDDWRRYKDRGDAYLRIGKDAEALADFSKIIALTPQEPGSYMLRALALKSIGRYDEALTDFSAVLEKKADDDDAFMERAECYRLMHRYDEALADLSKAEALQPSSKKYVSEMRAKIYAQQGNEEKARHEMLDLESKRQKEIHKDDGLQMALAAIGAIVLLLTAGGLFLFWFKKKRSASV